MAAQSRATLESYFETGDVPTQAQFAELIASYYSIVSDFSLAFGTVTQSSTNPPVFTYLFSTLGFTPVASYVGVGVYQLTSAGNLDVAKFILCIFPYAQAQESLAVLMNGTPDSLDIETYDSTGANADGLLSASPFVIFKKP